MTRSSIISEHGESLYLKASVLFQEHALDPDYGSNCSWGPSAESIQIDQDIANEIINSEMEFDKKLDLFFEIYADLPTYGMLMYPVMSYASWSAIQRQEWWEHFRIAMKGPWHRPLTYSLWCDFFEDPDTVSEAWKAMTKPLDSEIAHIILPYTGPVPWSLKAPVYGQLAGNRSLHQAIYEGILGSQFDVYGDIEPSSAQELLRRLTVDPASKGYAELSKALSAAT